jgi:hypothetical protein
MDPILLMDYTQFLENQFLEAREVGDIAYLDPSMLLFVDKTWRLLGAEAKKEILQTITDTYRALGARLHRSFSPIGGQRSRAIGAREFASVNGLQLEGLWVSRMNGVLE